MHVYYKLRSSSKGPFKFECGGNEKDILRWFKNSYKKDLLGLYRENGTSIWKRK